MRNSPDIKRNLVNDEEGVERIGSEVITSVVMLKGSAACFPVG